MERLTAFMPDRPDCDHTRAVQPRRGFRSAGLAIACGGALVLAAGCGASHGASAGPALTAQQAVTVAARTSAALNSAAATVTIAAGSEHLTENVLIELHPRLAMSATVTGVPGTGDIDVVVAGSTVYLKLSALATLAGRPWVELSGRGGTSSLVHELLEQAESGNLATQADLARVTSGVHQAGHQLVDGVPTTRYEGWIRPATALAHLPASLRTRLAPMLGEISGRLQVSFWVDAQHLIRKVAETETVNGQQVRTTIVYRDINQPVHITVPPASQVAPLTRLPHVG
jgi:hypothetical protein